MDLFNLLQQGNNNPMLQANPLFQRALQMTQGKSEGEIKQIVMNVAKQRGVDINQLNAMLGQFAFKL